jgi:CubicO group peptidase (beta-lactamase class C family)
MQTLTDPSSLGFDPALLARIHTWANGYVDSGKLPNLQVLVSRYGKLAWASQYGMADVARQTPVQLGGHQDTIYRIYSMTKPLTSVAVMALLERGLLQLDDPIKKWIPKLTNLQVYTGGKGAGGKTIKLGSNVAGDSEKLDLNNLPTEPQARDITVRDLLTHTAGFTYDFMMATPVDALYRARGINALAPSGTLETLIDQLSNVPLLAQPGVEWNYSVATDVLGYLVQAITDEPFDDHLRRTVLKPLGMTDTDFYVPPNKVNRFAACYTPAITSQGVGLSLVDEAGTGSGTGTETLPLTKPSRFLKPPTAPSGGGGLVGTGSDYLRFCHLMLNGGELDGVRLLGRKTVSYMLQNHLFKDGRAADMAAMGQPRFSESSYEGVGFGLGFSIVLNPAQAQTMGSAGEAAWGGAASTGFWIDPSEGITAVMLTQLLPSSTYPIRRQLRNLVYGALV